MNFPLPGTKQIAGLGAIAIMLMILSGCASSATPPTISRQSAITIYVVSHGWHSGIVIPAESDSSLNFLQDYFDDPDWYEIGWGDRKFYQANETDLWLMLRAGLLPTASVLHVVALSGMPADYFRHSRIIRLEITPSGYANMTDTIAETFSQSESHEQVVFDEGLYGESRFFAADGLFHGFNNCNSWTAEMLKQAGVPVRTFMIFWPSDVMNQLENITQEE